MPHPWPYLTACRLTHIWPLRGSAATRTLLSACRLPGRIWLRCRCSRSLVCGSAFSSASSRLRFFSPACALLPAPAASAGSALCSAAPSSDPGQAPLARDAPFCAHDIFLLRVFFYYLGELGLVGWQCFVRDPRISAAASSTSIEKNLGLAPMSSLLRHRGRGTTRANSLT